MTEKKSTSGKTLSTSRKILFYSITFATPILFFVLLEAGLRVANYKGDTKLFSDPKIPGKEYLIPNPNFAARYFFYTNTVPNPSTDVFLEKKPDNSFRIFAMGGSSAAGYPYGFNGTFSRVVDDILQYHQPEKGVEVVNIAVSAISSYTLYDQVAEVIQQQPDAVMIYAGHNEFYGALGVGSNENLGAFPGFVRFYLKLQRLKTFLLVRSAIVNTGKWFAETIMGKEANVSGTLMERIVSSRSIELDGPRYQLAMKQFRSNLSIIAEEFSKNNIDVYLGSIASNLKDQPPFVNIDNSELPGAQSVYDEAMDLLSEGRQAEALERFEYAKDLDGLKFRAPEEINRIIKEVSEQFENVHYVPTAEKLYEEAEDGIIGNDLMLEHLHPNQRGYFLIGKTFSEAILNDTAPNLSDSLNLDRFMQQMMLSELDQRITWHRVTTLKQGFPFVIDGSKKLYQTNYRPISVADSLAFRVVHLNQRWDEAKVNLGKHYESTGQPEKALYEYMGLVRDQPWNDSPYVFAARIYLDRNQFAQAEPLLRKAYSIAPKEAFTTKMLGAIALNSGNTKEAIKLLEESRMLQPNDPQMLYNLSGAYGTDQQFDKALNIAEQVIRINPAFPGIQQWKQQLLMIKSQQKN